MVVWWVGCWAVQLVAYLVSLLAAKRGSLRAAKWDSLAHLKVEKKVHMMAAQ